MAKNQLTAIEYSKEQQLVDTVRKTIFPNSTDAELMLFFHKCVISGVHPLDNMIVPAKYKQPDDTFKVAFITTIDYFRSRSNKDDFDGMDEIEYGEETIQEDKNGNEYDVPEYAVVKVYRKDVSRPYIGTARWKEYYPGEKKGFMWREKPYLMLGKCAEALALRKAYPQEFHHLYTAEEMERTTEQLAGIASEKPAISPDSVTAGDKQSPYEPVNQDGWSLPSDEDQSSKKLINEKQAKLLLRKCNENKVDPNAVAKAAKVENVYWLTWDKRVKTNFNVMLDAVQNHPNKFAKFTHAADVSKTAQATETVPETKYKEFEQLVTSLALQAGVDVEAKLDEKFKIDQLADVKPEQYNNVIDYFITLSEETPGA